MCNPHIKNDPNYKEQTSSDKVILRTSHIKQFTKWQQSYY